LPGSSRYDNIAPVSPTFVLSGDKDDWTSVGRRQAVKGKVDFEVVVYPGAFHAFVDPSGHPYDYRGHHIAYDVKAAPDAQEHA
jgi:dienelactone hydrolase